MLQILKSLSDRKFMPSKSQKDKSQKLYEAALQAEDNQQMDEAAQLYQEAIKVDKNLPLPQFKFAALLLEQEKYKEAIQVSRLFVKRWQWSLAYTIIGRSHLELGQYVKAEQAFQQSLAIKPTPATWVFLGFTLTLLEHTNKAIDCYHQALKLDPNYEEALYNLGCEYKLQNKPIQAEIHLRKAIAIDPKYSRACAELGRVLSIKGELKEAANLLRKSIRLEPDYGWARVYLANVLWRQRKLKAADEQYRKVIEMWPEFSLSYWCYGGFLASEQRDDVLAEQYLRKAVELEPQDEESNYWLGKCLLRWNRHDEAKIYLKKAARSGHLKATQLMTDAWPPRPKVIAIDATSVLDQVYEK
jgi:tetratricopeptide (TPR) repeat protein